MPRPRAWLVNGLLVCGGIGVALGLIEVGLRVAGLAYPFPWTLESERGLALRPGAEGVSREEGQGSYRINSDGLRDGEHAVPKPGGVYRIAVLGDSYAEALQVGPDEAFWAVLERRLAACPAWPGRRIEAINFGVSGYSTALSLITLKRKVWRFQPDLVLLAFFVGNDVADNMQGLSGYGRRPYFRLDGDRLVLDDSFSRTWRFRVLQTLWRTLVDPLIDHSRLVQLLNQLRRGRPLLPESLVVGAAQAAARGREAGLSAAVFRPPETPQWLEAWRISEALLLAMRDDARTHGADFRLVTLSVGWQVHPQPDARRRHMAAFGIEDAFYPERRLGAFAAKQGIGFLALAPLLQQFAEIEQRFLHGFGKANSGDGHWNATGHRLAGALIADDLCRTVAAG